VGYGVYQSYADDLIPPEQAIAQLPRGGARIYDRDGNLLWEVLNPSGGRYEPVAYDDIHFYLKAATIATEDASYWDNPGVNYKGLVRAGWENFSPFDDEPGFLSGTGGSSITQQLVKNIYFPPEERTERSVQRKLKEVILAVELNNKYSKEQILTWYLNQISFGSIYTGVEAASQGYFSKPAKELTLVEAATLAGIPACPSCYDPIDNPEGAVERRNYVLTRMVQEDIIDAEEAWLTAQIPLPDYLNPRPVPVEAPHFVFTYILPKLEAMFGKEAVEQDGLIVTTTLDMRLQNMAQQILNDQIDNYESSCNCHNGAVVAIDPQTAELLVMVGSRDYNREDIQGANNNALAENSPGSSFKPFTYITAFMNLGWGPGTMILDTPLPEGYWDGANPPRNPRGDYKGPITVRNALGNSLNIPAIKTLLYTSPEEDERAVVAQAKKMGITTLDKDLGPSMTVGGVDVRLLDMAYGYTVFPNLGLLKGVPTTLSGLPEGNRSLDPVAILKVTDRDGNVLYPVENGEPIADRPFLQEERVAGEAEAYMITDILSDGNARCYTTGRWRSRPAPASRTKPVAPSVTPGRWPTRRRW
jgi:membrane peptidoglycan carboxypeptidase